MNPDEFEQFRQDLSRAYGTHTVAPIRTGACRGRLELRTFGPFHVGIATGRFVRFARARTALDAAWHDSVFVVQQITGRTRVVHYGREVELMRNDIALIDSLGPCCFDYGDGAQTLAFPLPRAALTQLTELIRGSSKWAIPARAGIGRALSALVNAIGATPLSFDEEDRRLMIDTLVSFLTRCMLSRPTPCALADDALFSRMMSWARENLASFELGPMALAAQFGLSRRQVYRLFEQRATTPAACLWELRLSEAHDRLLADRQSAITEIAHSVGFKDSAHFSRAFRLRYGYAPRATRLRGQTSCA